jgi:hypothetical protein
MARCDRIRLTVRSGQIGTFRVALDSVTLAHRFQPRPSLRKRAREAGVALRVVSYAFGSDEQCTAALATRWKGGS